MEPKRVRPDRRLVAELRSSLPATVLDSLDRAVQRMVEVHRNGGAVVVVTGSGPNIHEGVTTFLAELVRRRIVQGVITSAAVVSHEMAGTLDRVKRIKVNDPVPKGIPQALLPRGDVFELTLMSPARREAIQGESESESESGWELYDRLMGTTGDEIIKAAGNMAWPMGPRTERLAREAERLARQHDLPLERVVGWGADPRTMIGAGARAEVPVIVSTPQLIGGGAVGLAIGDAISISRRCRIVADLLAEADLIIESAVALSQEIHDGPFETYTGHGLWAGWEGAETFSLRDKTLVRIDLDPNLELAWRREREGASVQRAIDLGLPKTKATGIPFRMEMSGFARLEGSIPVTADVGVAWPIFADGLERALALEFDFMSAPQETEAGQRMRAWIADEIRPADIAEIHQALETGTA